MKFFSILAVLLFSMAWGANASGRLSSDGFILVAHAAGAVDGNAYTNSRQAIDLSLDTGFSYLELDFSRSKDGQWYLLHDWPSWASRTGYQGELPPVANDVVQRLGGYAAAPSIHGVKSSYSTVPLGDLLRILDQRSGFKVVTDTKTDEDAMLLLESIPEQYRERFIFQTYSLDGMRQMAGLLGEQRVILTAYQLHDWWRWDGFNEEFLAALRAYPKMFAVTVPLSVAYEKEKLGRLLSVGIPVLVHGRPDEINSYNLPRQLMERGVSGAYVD
ncbi:hypothetical protein [Stenotrophomonas koreensis]|uniref:hypothetical protein n=1 Tax=Stenotrophomonas koreensis TaxID=266128 RepID=UPI000AFF455A|nr:hypothetical protein [Stenotrophomonas koreensis]